MKHCKQCGNLFQPSVYRPSQLFCQPKCRERDRHDRCREERNAKKRERWAANKDKHRQKYQENSDHHRQRSLEYYYEHRQERLEYKRERDAARSEQVQYWLSEALWAAGTGDADICVSLAYDIPQQVCWLSDDLEDFVSRWLDSDY